MHKFHKMTKELIKAHYSLCFKVKQQLKISKYVK